MIGEKEVLPIVEVNEDGNIVMPKNRAFPATLYRKIKEIPTEAAELDTSQLEGLVKPTYNDYIFKKRFWKEFHEADKRGSKMVMKNILQGVISQGAWISRTKNPHYLMWLITPQASYTAVIDSMLEQAKGRYEELINMPIVKYNKDGEATDEVDPKKAAILLSVIKNLEERSIGQALQRSVSIKATAPSDAVDVDAEAIDKRLAELESQLENVGVTTDSEKYIEAEVIDCGEAPVQQLIDDKEGIEAEDG